MTPPAEPPLPRLGLPGDPCHACEIPLAADQRYCLACGERRGGGGPIDFGALAARLRPPHAAPARGRLLAYPAPLAATMLVALLLAGIALGSLGSSPSAAGVAGGVDLVLPAHAPATAPGAAQPPAPPPPPAAAPASADPAPIDDTGTAASEPDGTGDSGADEDSGGDTSTADGSPIKHVFVIMLAEQAQPDAFAAGSAAPYLSGELVGQGTLLSGLRTIADAGLPTTIALLSGQGPNAQTQAGCPVYADVAPATVGDQAQEQGTGCVYSAQTATLANQLEQQGMTWRGYIEDQARGGPGVPTGCRRPALGAADPWRAPRPNDAYATARNPFVYFHAITDSEDCATNVADLSALDTDLAKEKDDVPSFSYIAPSLCHDGGAVPCALGAPAGPATADAFLSTIVPKIQASKAYDESLIVITFERAAAVARAPAATPPEPGGQVGALLLSPFVAQGDTIEDRYDTYSLLAMIEDVFGLDRLGLAAADDVEQISPSILTSGDATATTE